VNAVIIILLVLALVCFLVAAVVGYAAAPAADGRPVGWVRTNFVALGLVFWVATQLLVALAIK